METQDAVLLIGGFCHMLFKKIDPSLQYNFWPISSAALDFIILAFAEKSQGTYKEIIKFSSKSRTASDNMPGEYSNEMSV